MGILARIGLTKTQKNVSLGKQKIWSDIVPNALQAFNLTCWHHWNGLCLLL